MMIPCVFFDRDGIVNVAPVTRYVEKLDDFYLMEEFYTALRVVSMRGYAAIVVTNQKGVAVGKTPLTELTAMHDLIFSEARQRGLELRDILYCDATEDGHPRRKPNPGMILEAAVKHHIDLPRSWMIGDNESDVLTGQRAGCRTIYVGKKHLSLIPDFTVSGMSGLPALLEKELPDLRG